MTTPGVQELLRRREIARGLGGPERVARQHERGFLTARERVDLLLDPGSQLEFAPLVHSGEPGQEERTMGDGRLMGFGTIDGRPVAYAAGDATVKGASGGAGSRRRSNAFHRIVEQAAIPMFELSQGGGGRVTDIMTSRFAGWSGSALAKRLAFPRREALFIAVMGNYYAPWNVADADYSVMTATSNLSISSPPVVQEATGERVTPFDLGSAEVHSRITGQIDTVVEDDAAAIATLRKVFSYLPGNAWEEPPVLKTGDPVDRTDEKLRTLVPSQPNRAYNIKTLINSIADRDSFFELVPEYGKNLVIGLARFDGHPVVVVGNQPMQRAGALDIQACIKMKRALTMCERFRLPLVSLIDVPGVMPTKDQEHQRLLSHVYEMATQRLRAPVPKISVILRKAYGYALWGMSGCDQEWYSFAWPTAQIAFMGPEPGVRVAFRRDWETAPDPDAYLRERADEIRRDAEPWQGAELGYLDDVLDPAETRPRLIQALAVSRERTRSWRPPTTRRN